MNLRQSLVALIVFASSVMTLLGQCDVTLGADILDNSTGSIEIVIEGSINDNLSNIDQGLCGVELYFEHSRIRDISINLESPSGQSVVLVGPATGVGGITQFTYWGVEFVPCDSTAMPDLDGQGNEFADEFTTEDSWGILGDYIGQYYPQQGCLEDFDTGPVNGIWTLNFTDVSQFSEGVIDSIKLIFCDSTNVYCQECLASGGSLSSVGSDYCESDPDLNLDIETEFEIEPSSEYYSYNYLIVEAGEIIGANQEPDLSGLSFGSYLVCGISSLVGQTDDILDDVIGTDYDDLSELFSDNDYCAAMSTNCIPINIIDVPDTILTIESICLGDVLILNGTEYTETGQYVIGFSQAFCESVSILDLTVINNQAAIIADSDTISCLDGDVLLDATGSITSSNTIMNWFKVDDVIDPNIVTDEMITVTEPGVYGLSLITGMCSDTAYFEIFNDVIIPSFTFDVDTISCINPIVLIDMTPSQELQIISWSPVNLGVEDISVAVSGTYYIEGLALNGCVGRDSVFVEEYLDVPEPVLLGDIITCALDTATIIAILPDSISFAYTWDGPNIVGGSTSGDAIQVIQDTTYILSLQNLDNGCIEEFEYTVLIDTSRTNFLIQSTIIDCVTPESEISVSPAIDTIDYQWEYLDQGFMWVGYTISVDQGGVYQLITTTGNGCIDTFLHTVVIDTLSPVVLVDDVTISCLMDSIQLVSNTIETDLTYFWDGPGDYESTEASPFASNPGSYILEVTNTSGCTAYTFVNLIAGVGLPDLTFAVSDTFDCNVDLVTITPSDTLNLRFEWQSTEITDTTAHIIDVVNSGTYTLLVTDTITGCNLFYDVIVHSDYEQPIPIVDVPIIDCNNPMVALDATFMIDIDSLKWTTDFGYNSTDQSTFITQVGDYYITAVGLNGCTFTDTITVMEDTDLPILSIDVPLLDCLNSSVDVSFISENVTDDLMIRLPDGNLIPANSINVTEPNSYMAIATSLNGCMDSMLMEVLQDIASPNASLLTIGQINCTESTVTILIDDQEEALTYDWTGVSIISPLGLDSIVVDAVGVYEVIITDTANCTTTLDIEIQPSIDFPVVTSIVDTINCTEVMASIALEVPVNTILITWDGPSSIAQDITEFSTDVSGSYIATVTADNNCVTMHTVTVEVDTISPIIDVMTSGILDCDTEVVTLSSSSDMIGSTYEWLDPDNIVFTDASIDVSISGMYDLLVTAPNTCTIDTFIVVELDTLKPTILTGPDPTFNCAGDLYLTIETTTNITSYDWDGPLDFGSDSNEPMATAPGLYTVTVTNHLGCFAIAEINVIADTIGPVIMVRDTFIICDLFAVLLPLETNDDEISYTWDAPGFASNFQNPETNIPGEYIVYAMSNRNECVTVDTVNLTYVEIPPIFDLESSNINCYIPQTSLKALDVEDDFSATWTDDNFIALAEDSLLVEMADSFYLIVVGTNACEDTVKVIVEENFEQVDLEILQNEPFQCNSTDVTLEGNIIGLEVMDNFSPTWTTIDGSIESGEQTFVANISGEGTYLLTVFNLDNGCESVDSIELIKEEQSLLGLTIEENGPNCLGFEDGSIVIVNVEGGYGPYQYSLNGGGPQSDSIFTELNSGSYMIQVEDSIGCTLEMNIDLLDGLDFMATAESDTLIILGDTINLNSVFNIPDEEISAITWTAHNSDYSCDDCFEPPVSPLISTYYTLHATSEYGCQDSSQVLIKVNRNPDIEVANVFAPGSETNGLFYIQQTRAIEKVLSMSIFDKWASRMFFVENVFPADPSAAWDGTYKGQYVNPGVYVVVVELLLYSGEVVIYGGDITVLR